MDELRIRSEHKNKGTKKFSDGLFTNNKLKRFLKIFEIFKILQVFPVKNLVNNLWMIYIRVASYIFFILKSCRTELASVHNLDLVLVRFGFDISLVMKMRSEMDFLLLEDVV